MKQKESFITKVCSEQTVPKGVDFIRQCVAGLTHFGICILAIKPSIAGP